MSEWKARRSWKDVLVRDGEGGWQVWLDARVLRTPGKQALTLPTRALAQAVAQEWRDSGEVIDPGAMPMTRYANSAIEKVRVQFDAVADMLAEYGATDLLCYRADQPQSLAEMQAQAWDPLIDWAATRLAAPLRITEGVIPVAQPPQSLLNLRNHLAALDDFGLTAAHDLIALPGSIILGLAVLHGRLDAAEAHRLSRLDEDFQARQWGRDDEAEAAAATRAQALQDAARFWALSQDAAESA